MAHRHVCHAAAKNRLSPFAHRRSAIRRSGRFTASIGACAVLLVLVFIVSAIEFLQNVQPFGRSFPIAEERTIDALDADSEREASSERDPRRLDMYPADGLLTQPYADSENKFFVILHIVGIAYMFLGLNTVCDVYFTGALDMMVDQWEIQPDVAGATFMAAGGSAPELFTSLVGTTIAINDVGFGTIVGSAVFNVLFVIGICGYVAKTEIVLTWWPLFRDCSYYIFGLTLLAVCASDFAIALHEAVLLFLAYLLYCTVMYFNPTLEKLVDFEYWKAKRTAQEQQQAEERHGDVGDSEEPKVAEVPAPDPHSFVKSASQSSHGLHATDKTRKSRISQNHTLSGSKARMSARLTAEARERHEQRMASVAPCSSPKTSPFCTPSGSQEFSNCDEPVHKAPGSEGSTSKQGLEEGDQESDDEPGLLDKPESPWEQAVWYVSLPLYVLLHCGIPQPDEKWFLATFAVSLVWIAGFSFLLVWWVEILGQVIGVPTIIMGLTVLAAGTSIPDAASSVAVAKMGEGDMAVSSSVGSNIFDILVGLPVPWMIKIAIIQRDPAFTVAIQSKFIKFYVLLLLCMVVLVVLSIHCLGWKLNKALGLCMAALYATFLVIALVVEIQQPTALMF